ncbi:MAG TPA: pantetheine-phosphate adenylyltransferase [Acidimicrobiia bacterium]|nr:pantetheine-phosphate adenylyltransferase [Acidimicrobiia bacterium]
MTNALCPGSFDPPTHGHIDVIQRAASIFDQVTVAVVRNPSKSALFTTEERVVLLEEVLADTPGVEVASFEGLLVQFARDRGADVIVKGLRAMSDFDYELQMAQMNFRLEEFDTVFIATNPEYGYLSSSLVREVARLGGSIEDLVPPVVAKALAERLTHG